MVKVDQASMVPAEASTKKAVDIKRFASPAKKAQQKTPDGSSSRAKSAPSTRPTFSPAKKRAVDLSKVPESRQQEATKGANPSPSPSRIRESRRERTTLEAALDRVQAKRETAITTEEASITTTEDEEQSTTSSSAMSDESSVMKALSEAKARYDRMLTERKRRKAKQIKKLRSKTSKKSSASTTPASSSPTASEGASEDIFSLHSEFRVESVEASAAAVAAALTTITSKKSSKKSKNDALFQEEARVADDEQSVKVIQTDAVVNAVEDMSSDDAVPAESLATSVYRLVATKSVDTEATPSSLGAKLEQYESKLHNLEKFLVQNGDDGADVAKSGEEDKLAKADEDTPLEGGDLEDVEDEDEDEIADLEAMPTDDISYDEDTAARLLLGDDAEEARTEEQAADKATPSSGEREGAELFTIPDCTNFCYWMFYGEDAPKGATTESLPEEEADLSPEELVEKLARRMAMDAVLPKKKVSRTKSLHSKPVSENDDDVITIYNRVEASAFVSRDVRMERAARRAIAAEVLKQALLAGYSTIDAEEDEPCPCKKCGNQFLLNEAGTKECVVCPVLKSDLSRVTKQMMREDPQHQVKTDLEMKLRSLKKRATAKETIAKTAVEEEAAALQGQREAKELLANAEQAATDAEVELLWKTKELRQARDASRAASQKAKASLELALEDKAEAKLKAKLNVRLAENACTEADYQHIFGVKETALAELKIFIADEAVRKAIEARNKAVAEFQDMKRCTARLHSELETKKVEKAYAVAGASMLLSKKDTDIKTQQALREEAELKAVELANKLLLEKAEAELAVKKAQETLKRAEVGIDDAEKIYHKAHEKRESAEKVANDARSKANGTAWELEDTITEFNCMITEERSELKSTVGKRRADAMELATWDEQARKIFEAKDTIVVVEEEVSEEGELEEEENADDAATDVSPDIEFTPSIETVLIDEEEEEEEVDETLAKDSWNFYHEVCGLISNRWKYEEAYRQLQIDPLYPYLNSCSEVNCDDAQTKDIMHKSEAAYKDMSAATIATDLQKKAEIARPQLIKLCKDLAKSLKISKIGVGPIKEVTAALEKADKKYGGNVLQVTDFCRTFVVVKDVPTLLAVFEMMNSMMADRICRIKFSSLKKDGQALPGGYRDCKINLLVEGHICEVQVHLQSFWSVSQVQGYAYYQKAVEYSIDRIKDPYRSLKSISDKVLTKLITYGNGALAGTTLDTLAAGDDEQLLNYFALAGIYLRLKETAKAEAILVRLAALRSRNSSMGPLHSETLYLKKNLETALRAQDLIEEADVIAEQLIDAEKLHKEEADDATASLWEFLLTDDILENPYHQDDAEVDEKEQKEIIASRNQWLQSRNKLFKKLKGIKCADTALSLLNEQ